MHRIYLATGLIPLPVEPTYYTFFPNPRRWKAESGTESAHEIARCTLRGNHLYAYDWFCDWDLRVYKRGAAERQYTQIHKGEDSTWGIFCPYTGMLTGYGPTVKAALEKFALAVLRRGAEDAAALLMRELKNGVQSPRFDWSTPSTLPAIHSSIAHSYRITLRNYSKGFFDVA